MAAHEAFAEPGGRDKAPAAGGPGGAPAAGRDLRLAYLDGLRAAAAGYVVMFHAVPGFSAHELTGAWRVLRRAFAFGHESVAIFIVLSGYCLMLPVVRKDATRLPVELGRFVRRRALRILPPYFATLVLSLALLAACAPLRERTGTIWDDSLPGLDAGAIVSHLLVLHNWWPSFAYQINGPLWSVASEWQIYFFFPLVLLPVWRRLGMPAALLAAAVLGYAPLLFWRDAAMVAIPWYLLLFTFGMAAAAIGFSPSPLTTQLRHLSWGWLCATLGVGCFGLGMGAAKIWFANKALADLLVGLFTMTLLVHLTERAQGQKPSRLLRWLEYRPLVALGHFSYSLYLTHLPVLALCYVGLRGLDASAGVRSLLLLAVGSLLSLAIAYGFHRAVERPFMLRR
jgi:peptidoglycan/LPS O-acetylase OafA/YrhL